jgi:outer membrane lipoprotein-sorting protein
LNEKTQQLVHRELVPAGQTIDPFRLGEGVFPIPFGQKKKDMLDHFTIRLIPPTAKDPAGCDHLELTPRPDTDMARRNKGKSLLLHLYIDRRLSLPARIVNETRDERVTVDFTAIEINPKVAEKDFKLEKPPGYNETTVPLNK